MFKILPCSVSKRCFSSRSILRNNNFNYCVDLVKKHDYENYLCLLLLPVEIRLVGMVIRAFNVELATIGDSTTELKTSRMRIDFWRKNLERTFDGHPPAHPVTVSLALCLQKQMLSKYWFHRLIDIRERYLNNTAFMSLTDAEEYGEYSVSPIFYLMLETLKINNATVNHAVSHLGKMCSLITLIRSVPYFIRRRQVILPAELCVKHSVSHEDIICNRNKEGVREVIYDTASQAHVHLEHFKKLESDIPKSCRRIFLPSVTCEFYLKHLQRINFNVYDPNFNRRHGMLPLKLFFASWKNS